MATHEQALKRHRQSEKRHERNKHYKSAVRTRMKKTLDAIASKNPEQALAAFKDAQSHMMDAGRKRVVHPRTAARKISRLAKKLNSLRA